MDAEKLQKTAIRASDALERAHEIYHAPGTESKDVFQIFSMLDNHIVKLKNERQTEQSRARFINFKAEFKRDLAEIFDRQLPSENSQLLTTITKGLLIGALEKQNIKPEKMDLGSKMLGELSRTIALTIIDGRKQTKITREKAVLQENSRFDEQGVDKFSNQLSIESGKYITQSKVKQMEYKR